MLLFFQSRKLECGSSSCARPVTQTCFYFFTYTNCNARAAVSAAGIVAAGTVLSNIFLAVLAFLNCENPNTEVAVVIGLWYLAL